MEEQLISFETAKLAKEKRFDLTKLGYKEENGEIIDTYSTTTQSLLQKWLREEHKIHIVIMPCIIPSNEVKYYIFTGKLKWDWAELFDTYEEALEVGLQEALKLVKF